MVTSANRDGDAVVGSVVDWEIEEALEGECAELRASSGRASIQMDKDTKDASGFSSRSARLFLHVPSPT